MTVGLVIYILTVMAVRQQARDELPGPSAQWAAASLYNRRSRTAEGPGGRGGDGGARVSFYRSVYVFLCRQHTYSISIYIYILYPIYSTVLYIMRFPVTVT